MRRLIALAFMVLLPVLAHANTVASSTLEFEGMLTDNGDGSYSGVIPMIVAGAYDIYGEEGATAWFGNDPGTGPVWTSQAIGADHDAWPTWNPDTPDWYQYSLDLYVDGSTDKWAVRNHAGATADHPWYDEAEWGAGGLPAKGVPMSGHMYWAMMHAGETDTGAYLPGTGTAEIPGGAAAQGGGPATWDMDWSWGSEVVPLEYTGFDVEITALGGDVYHVTLTPAAPDEAYVSWAYNDTWAGWGSTFFSSIQDAIDAVAEGGTVYVEAGIYVEEIHIDKPVHLYGASAHISKKGYAVPADYAWNDNGETIIMHPDPAGGYDAIVDIFDVSDVTFDGFIVQELGAVGNQNTSLVRVYADSAPIENIKVENCVIGPNTNTVSQDGTHGRMGLYIVNHPYGDNGVMNSSFSHNKFFDCKGNGNNIFLWSSYYAYGAPGPASMAGTVIDDNEIYGSHRSGIETAGGFADLVISNNLIYGNSGLPGDDPDKLKYGHGILLIRGSSDKVSDPLTAYGPVDLLITGNEIYDNEKSGIYMGPKNDGITITGNVIRDNGWNGMIVDLVGNFWNPQFEDPPASEQYACYDCSEDVEAYNNEIYGNGGAANPISQYGVMVNGEPSNGFEFEASPNWWGDLDPTDQISGAVVWSPMWSDASMTTLAYPPVHNVNQDTYFMTIGAAVADALDGDTIEVGAGSYTEEVPLTPGVNLTLAGAGRDVVTWTAPTDGKCLNGSFAGYTGTMDYEIYGFTFQCRTAATTGHGTGINLNNASHGPLTLSIHDCRFIEDLGTVGDTTWGTSMWLCHNRFAERVSGIAPVKIYNNIDQTLGGITMSNTRAFDIYNNTFDGCSDAIYNGHGCPDSDPSLVFGDHHIYGNDFLNASDSLHPGSLTPSIDWQYYGAGVGTHLPSVIENNLFQNNDTAVRFVMDTDMTYPAHVISGNGFSGNGTALLVTGGHAAALDASGNWWGDLDPTDDISGPADYSPWLTGGTVNSPGFTGDFATLYVDDDSPMSGAEGWIQEGCDLVSGSTVHVLDGTYIEDNITVTQSLEIIGESEAGVIIAPSAEDVGDGLSMTDGTPQHGIMITSAGVTVRQLTIDGNANNIANGGTLPDHKNFRDGIATDDGYSNLLVEDVTVRNVRRRGISLNYAVPSPTNHAIRRCTVEEAENYCIRIGADNSIVQDNVGINCGLGMKAFIWDMDSDPAQTVYFLNNTLTHVGIMPGMPAWDAGWYCEAFCFYHRNYDRNVVFQGNHVTDRPGAREVIGIKIYNGDDTSLVGGPNPADKNLIELTGNDGDNLGIYVGGCAGATVQGNEFILRGKGRGMVLGRGNGVVEDIVPNLILDNSITSTSPNNDDADWQSCGIIMSNDPNFPIHHDGWYEDPQHLFNTITGNTISGLKRGVYFHRIEHANTLGADLRDNTIEDCELFGVDAALMVTDVDARDCWWGEASGPYHTSLNPLGLGNEVTDHVIFEPWQGIADLAVLPASGAPINCDDTVTLTVHYTPDALSPGLRGYSVTFDSDTELIVTEYDITQIHGFNLFDVVDNGDGTITVDAAYYGSTTLGVEADLFSVVCDADASGTADFEITDYTLRDSSNQDFFAAIAGAQVEVDCDVPAAATDLAAAPGHNQVTVTWTDPADADLVEVEVWRGMWHDGAGASAYPEYDDLAGDVIPARPADRAAALASNPLWVLAGTAPAGVESFVDNIADRGIYYYEVFPRDPAFNYAPPTAETDRATSYWLADVAPTVYDGKVDVEDISLLGASYGEGHGDTYYDAELDVGPTDDHSGSGIPETDDVIGFEDMMIFALNYSVVSPLPAVHTGSAEPVLAWYPVDENTWALSLAEECSDLKALRVVMEAPAGVVLSVEQGSLLGRQDQPVFFRDTAGAGLDLGLAVMGSGRSIQGKGELLRVALDQPALLGEPEIEARDSANEALDFAIEYEAPVPTSYQLARNYPNPFNPKTTIRFDLPETQPVRLVVFDANGRRVRVLVDETRSAGFHSVSWNGRNDQGARVSSGIYFYRIDAGPLKQTERMVLLK